MEEKQSTGPRNHDSGKDATAEEPETIEEKETDMEEKVEGKSNNEKNENTKEERGKDLKQVKKKFPIDPNLTYMEIFQLINKTVKETRKSKDDVALLQNRIAHLKKEYKISKKKIEDTNFRTNEILHQKEIRQKKTDTKKKIYQSRQQLVKMDAQVNQKQKEEARRRRLAWEEAQKKKKLQLKQDELKLRETIKSEKQKIKKQNEIENQKKRQRRLDELKRLKEKEQREEELKRKRKEEERKREREWNEKQAQLRLEAIRKLEEEELRMIQELKDSQNKQAKTYQELENALSTNI